MTVVGRALAVVLALGVASGCSDEGEDYCSRVQSESAELTRTVDAGGGATGLLDALPTLEDLAQDAPADIEDEWTIFLDAVRGLRDVLEETDTDPEEIAGDLESVPADDRARIREAATHLASADVVDASEGIDQHALDVCHTPLL